MTAFCTSPLLGTPFSDPEQTNPSGDASTSTPKFGERRSDFGSSEGTTGRSFTTVSSPFFCDLRARTTRPCLSRSRPGVSKKNTWRICACRGSTSRARSVELWSASGTVSFSSTLSASWIRPTSSWSCSSENAARVSDRRRHQPFPSSRRSSPDLRSRPARRSSSGPPRRSFLRRSWPERLSLPDLRSGPV